MALSLYRIGWISPPNKKNGAFGGRIYHALIRTYLPSKPVLSLEGFLCVTLQIALMKIQGYSTREIAVYLDITEKAVYRRMDRLKEKLKKFFE